MRRYAYSQNAIPWDVQSDVDQMCSALESINIRMIPADIYKAWADFSHNSAAGWMQIPDNPQDIWMHICPYVDEVE